MTFSCISLESYITKAPCFGPRLGKIAHSTARPPITRIQHGRLSFPTSLSSPKAYCCKSRGLWLCAFRFQISNKRRYGLAGTMPRGPQECSASCLIADINLQSNRLFYRDWHAVTSSIPSKPKFVEPLGPETACRSALTKCSGSHEVEASCS